MAKAKVAATETEQTAGENTAAETQAAPAEKAPKAAPAEEAPRLLRLKRPKSAQCHRDKFVFQKDLAEGQKFAPQALLIVKHVKAHNTITRDQLCEELSKDPEFKTKQPVGRIVSYYQKDLVNAGLFTIEK
jgi:hypothetical protein